MRSPIPTWYFALVVVRLGHRFLVVRERKHGQLWYLPAGRVEPGESVFAAAARETLEESSVPIEVEGVLRVEHSPRLGGTARIRVFCLARPVDDTPPKSVPDDESLEARWVTLEELDALDLRGEEVRAIFEYVAGGGACYPMSVWGEEGRPWG